MLVEMSFVFDARDADVNRVELLMTLYNLFVPQSPDTVWIPLGATRAGAATVIEANKGYVDYWRGVPIKANLKDDDIDLTLYLRDNARDKSQVIKELEKLRGGAKAEIPDSEGPDCVIQ